MGQAQGACAAKNVRGVCVLGVHVCKCVCAHVHVCACVSAWVMCKVNARDASRQITEMRLSLRHGHSLRHASKETYTSVKRDLHSCVIH